MLDRHGLVSRLVRRLTAAVALSDVDIRERMSGNTRRCAVHPNTSRRSATCLAAAPGECRHEGRAVERTSVTAPVGHTKNTGYGGPAGWQARRDCIVVTLDRRRARGTVDRVLVRKTTGGVASLEADIAAAKNDGLDNAEPRTRENTTPTSFRQWCVEVLKPAVLS